ncbi:MAG: hypothetical protein BGO82_07435 [Devosia sp. 67-54]|uniref:hypothetical protein n=1 Tax=unclassified Devosia TaxID=196773 RepID=UPI00096138BE|nr:MULTISPECIES: hypothetical protein [unclassified Devosia]MBN9307148.1 hypothetical protein [Devosia sp.]OJX19550.1 MAG: hypothetical protein BGO82_07435 [Devosia sp. 67-54]
MRRIIVAALLVVSSSSAFAAMDKGAHDRFVARCQTSMYMSGAQCSCMAGIADKKLDALAIAYLSLDPLDVRNSAAMSKQMTGKELAAVDNFMKTAPHQCKGAR